MNSFATFDSITAEIQWRQERNGTGSRRQAGRSTPTGPRWGHRAPGRHAVPRPA